MSKHTAGPWEAVGSCVRTMRTQNGGGFFVADCWRKWEESVEFAFDGTEADANARFISMAPQMGGMLLKIKERPNDALKIFKDEGFIFDGSGGRWEKLAFSLYNMLILDAENAGALLDYAEGHS